MTEILGNSGFPMKENRNEETRRLIQGTLGKSFRASRCPCWGDSPLCMTNAKVDKWGKGDSCALTYMMALVPHTLGDLTFPKSIAGSKSPGKGPESRIDRHCSPKPKPAIQEDVAKASCTLAMLKDNKLNFRWTAQHLFEGGQGRKTESKVLICSSHPISM